MKSFIISTITAAIVGALVIFVIVNLPHEIITHIKLTDWLLVIFTFCLVLVTARQADLTQKTAEAAKKSAEALPLIERAWIFTGIAPTLYPKAIIFLEHEIQINLTYKNFGRTPGIVKKIHGEFSFTEPLTDVATYSNKKNIIMDEVINSYPDPKTVHVAPESFSSHTMSIHYFHGYIEYDDVFKEKHISKFCYRIIPSEKRFEGAGGPAWNDYD